MLRIRDVGLYSASGFKLRGISPLALLGIRIGILILGP